MLAAALLAIHPRFLCTFPLIFDQFLKQFFFFVHRGKIKISAETMGHCSVL